MLKILKRLFSAEPEPDYSVLLKNNAVILDVRSKNEYASGHIKGSKNIPLNAISANLKVIGKKDRPVITCCASGMRSASARNILKNLGYTNVHNGGGWKNLQQKIS